MTPAAPRRRFNPMNGRTSRIPRARRRPLERAVSEELFSRSPREIAVGLQRAVRGIPVAPGTELRSALSMLREFIRRGGKRLSAWRRTRLREATREIRREFGRK